MAASGVIGLTVAGVAVAVLTVVVTVTMRSAGGWTGLAKHTGLYVAVLAVMAAVAVLALFAVHLVAG